MNISWSPPAEEVAAAEAMPWDMPGAFALRRMTYRTMVRTSAAGSLMYGFAAISCFLMFDHVRYGRGTVLTIGALAVLGAFALASLGLFVPPQMMVRIVPLGAMASLVGGGALTTVFLLATRAQNGAVAVLYLEAPIFAFYMFRRWAAAVLVALVCGQFAFVEVWHHRSVGLAIGEWFVVASSVAVTGVVIGGIAARAEQLAESEHEARAELADLNANLAARVASQVDELDRLGKMRRFLSPQIADAVVSEGADELLKPHRRRIAVLFCDLRGFTAFTNRTEPEEVVALLDEYYEAVGTILREHEATIGSYSGDGIMAYFGDPVIRESAANDAVTAGAEISGVLDELGRTWTRRDHAVSYGIGIAYGYATLGIVGFDSRYDYTPLGAVVNLAARLCAAAAPGQVLLDSATHLEVAGSYRTTELHGLDLKGFDGDVRVYALSSQKTGGTVASLHRAAFGR